MAGTATIPRIVGTPGEVTVAGASAQSSTLTALAAPGPANCFRLVSTTDCRILVGANPTALATSAFLPAYAIEYVRAELTDKVAVIQEAAGGKLSVTACMID